MLNRFNGISGLFTKCSNTKLTFKRIILNKFALIHEIQHDHGYIKSARERQKKSLLPT